MADSDWYDEDDSFTEEYPVTEYDLTAVPNDFNVTTIVRVRP